MKEITIASTNVSIKEYQGQRVLTFKDIDTVHKRPDGTARRNFNTNKKHFIEGEDYFKICADEIRTSNIVKLQNGLNTLVVQSGQLF